MRLDSHLPRCAFSFSQRRPFPPPPLCPSSLVRFHSGNQRAVTLLLRSIRIGPMSKSAAFENCFAAGLDLSEFSAEKSATSSSSHAARHLQSTQKKAEQRRANEQQEFALAQAIQKHHQAVKSSSKPRNKAHAALLHMHTVEQSDEPRQRLVKKGPKTLKKKNRGPQQKQTTKQSGKRRGR